MQIEKILFFNCKDRFVTFLVMVNLKSRLSEQLRFFLIVFCSFALVDDFLSIQANSFPLLTTKLALLVCIVRNFEGVRFLLVSVVLILIISCLSYLNINPEFSKSSYGALIYKNLIQSLVEVGFVQSLVHLIFYLGLFVSLLMNTDLFDSDGFSEELLDR